MGNEVVGRRNCAQYRTADIEFVGITTEAFRAECYWAMGNLTSNQAPMQECMDFYIQPGHGDNLIGQESICHVPVEDKDKKKFLMEKAVDWFRENILGEDVNPSPQPKIVDGLKAIRIDEFRKLHHDLSAALLPNAKSAVRMKDSFDNADNIKFKAQRMFLEAKNVLCGLGKEIPQYSSDPGSQCERTSDGRIKDDTWFNNIAYSFKSVFHLPLSKNIFGADIHWSPSAKEAEEAIMSWGPRMDYWPSERESRLIALYLENINNALHNRSPLVTNLSRDFSRISENDLSLIEYFGAVVPTLSTETRVGPNRKPITDYLGDLEYVNMVRELFGEKLVDIEAALTRLEELESLKKEFEEDREKKTDGQMEVLRKVIKEIETLLKVRENYNSLPSYIRGASGAYKTMNAYVKPILDESNKKLREFEKLEEHGKTLTPDQRAERTAAKDAKDAALALAATMITLFKLAKMNGRRDFSMVLVATMWMNHAINAADDKDRPARVGYAREALSAVQEENLSDAEKLWLREVRRVSDLIAQKVLKFECAPHQEWDGKACWETVRSCFENNEPPQAFNAKDRMCVPCGDDETVRIVRNASGTPVRSSCARKAAESETSAIRIIDVNTPAEQAPAEDWGGSNPYR